MSGNAIVYDGIWPETGEKIDVRYVAPVAGASKYWSAIGMDPGPAPVWTDRVAGSQLVAPSVASQQPTVYESQYKVMRFNGANQRMDLAMSLSAPITFFMVGRFTDAAIGDYLMTGGQSGGSFNLYVTGTGTFGFFAGKGLNSGVMADTLNRIFIVTVNGANSAFRVNSTEIEGDLGVSSASAIRIGASASDYTPGDILGMGFYNKALSAAERAQLYSNLNTQYFGQ